MRYYFYGALATLFFVAVYLWKSKTTKQYQFLHNILKLLLLIGVLSLILAQKNPELTISAIEIEPIAAQEALLNLNHSPFPKKIELIHYIFFLTLQLFDFFF